MAEARYDAVADFYEAGWSDALGDPVVVALLDLLGPVDGLSILDAACGHGRLTGELARRGAHPVGLDISAALLAKAPPGPRYVHGDVAAPGVLGGETFDAAVCSFGLSDIDDLDGALATIAGALRVDGVFAFSILHPCFAGGGEVSGSWPSTGRYSEEGGWAADAARSTLRRQVGANHRTLATYVNALRRHGLWLDRLAEPGPPPQWSDDVARYPAFLVARCVARPS